MNRRNFFALAAAALTLASFDAHGACTPVQGTSGAAPTATLTAVLPTTNTDGTPIATPTTLNLYQGTASGSEAKVQTGITGTSITINTGLVDGTTYFWEVTLTDAKGTSSALSNEVCKQFPNGIPGAVTITITDNKVMFDFVPLNQLLDDRASPEWRLF